jgi:hypothetical protein
MGQALHPPPIKGHARIWDMSNRLFRDYLEVNNEVPWIYKHINLGTSAKTFSLRHFSGHNTLSTRVAWILELSFDKCRSSKRKFELATTRFQTSVYKANVGLYWIRTILTGEKVCYLFFSNIGGLSIARKRYAEIWMPRIKVGSSIAL